MEVLVPLRGRKLAGNDGGACAAAIIEEFEQIVALGIGGGREAEIVQDEDVEASELAEGADVSAVGTSQGELVEEPRGAAVQSAVAFAAVWGVMRRSVSAGLRASSRRLRVPPCTRRWRSRAPAARGPVSSSDEPASRLAAGAEARPRRVACAACSRGTGVRGGSDQATRGADTFALRARRWRASVR